MGYKGIIVVELMVLLTILDKTLAAAINTDEHVPAAENMPPQSLIDAYSPLGAIEAQKPRLSRSPSNQIRFGRSQSFVRFGRSNAANDNYASRINSQLGEKFLRLAQHSNVDNVYPNDENIRIETRGHEDNGFIRFGRSQNKLASKNDDAARSINWRNFLRLGRNTNANIRFAGKRDGSSAFGHHGAAGVPLDVLLDKYAQRPSHRASAEPLSDPDTIRAYADDDQMLDDLDANVDQAAYNSANSIDN